MARISRKELKTDEVRETFAHGAEAVLSHRASTLILLIIAVVVALSIFGWRTYSQRQTTKAFAAFDSAMQIFQAPVNGPAAPGEATYTDSNAKFTDAAENFSVVASQYPRTHAGQLARYYTALSLERLDKDEEAKKDLQGLTNSSDEDVAAMAKFELAQLYDSTGQGDQALPLYQQLIAAPTVLVPKAEAMLALAEHYAATNPSEAAKLYGQIKSDYPDSPIAERATQALSLLPGNS